MLIHTLETCLFKHRSYLFSHRFLRDPRWLMSLPYCSCFQFAIRHNHEAYQAMSRVTEEEYQTFLEYSDNWKFVHETDYRYNLSHGENKNYRDAFIKKAFKEFDAEQYYRSCDKNKTPEVGRMFFSMLQFLYPPIPKPSTKERYFYTNLEKAINVVFSHFDSVKPISREESIFKMPKNTSAGFVSLKYLNKKVMKGECLPEIRKQYNENIRNIIKRKPVNDYCTFAMRGHLSDRTKKKTRAIWLVSASTIVSEGRFLLPFYDQINEKEFFRNIWITGKDSLPRLNRYLTKHPDRWFYNTDISGWDSYRASWFHHRIFKELSKKILFNNRFDRLEYKYIEDSSINTKCLFPNGMVYKKRSGVISGTLGTLLINSLLNTIGTLTIMSMMKEIDLDYFGFGCEKAVSLNWLGDDFAFFYNNGNFPLEKFCDMYYTYFGCLTNADKTVKTDNMNERKYLGYQLKGGFLHRDRKEFIQALLYMERPMSKEYFFQISFSRFFSYLLLGGVNDWYILEFFYYYLGRYKDIILSLDVLYQPGSDNIFKLLKDVWNVNIPLFNLNTFQSMSTELMKYCLLYGYDLNFKDLTAY